MLSTIESKAPFFRKLVSLPLIFCLASVGILAIIAGAKTQSFIMTRKIISLLAAAFLAFVPANAQSSRAAAAEAAAPKTGIRFVVCSPTNAKLPSPLYYQTGKEFKPVRIGGRTPSPRIKPIGGKVCFWDQDLRRIIPS